MAFSHLATHVSRDRVIVVVDVEITTTTLPMLASVLASAMASISASAMESRCADTAVIRNLTLNPSFNPLLVCQFRILFTKLHSAYVIAKSYAAMTLAQIQDGCKIREFRN